MASGVATGRFLVALLFNINDHLVSQEVPVITVSLADAKAHLSSLIARAAAGEPVCITRRGKPIAQITGINSPRKRINIAELRRMTGAMPAQPETAGEFIRRMRDESRY
jgi:prevent-host-death family protein